MRSPYDFALSPALRKKLAECLRPEMDGLLSWELNERLDVVEGRVLEYLQDIEMHPDDVLPKSNKALRQLGQLSAKFRAAADAIDDKDDLFAETAAAAEAFSSLDTILADVLLLDLPDSITDSKSVPTAADLHEFADKVDDLAQFFNGQPPHRGQKPMFRRNALICFLVEFFRKHYPEEEMYGRAWEDLGFLDNCENFVHSVLTEAEIDCPGKSRPGFQRENASAQGRLRRLIKTCLLQSPS